MRAKNILFPVSYSSLIALPCDITLFGANLLSCMECLYYYIVLKQLKMLWYANRGALLRSSIRCYRHWTALVAFHSERWVKWHILSWSFPPEKARLKLSWKYITRRYHVGIFDKYKYVCGALYPATCAALLHARKTLSDPRLLAKWNSSVPHWVHLYKL